MGKKSRKGKPKTGQKGGGVARAPAAAAGSPAAADTLAPRHGARAPAVAADVPSSDTPTTQPSAAPPGAACWICLDGDPDDGGKPIVRDCSCRGDDAGFAHLSCLIKYAEGKSKEIVEAAQPGQNPNEPWEMCPHCRREYQGQVGLGMAKSLLSFIDETYNFLPGTGMELIKLGALTTIVKTVVSMNYIRNPELREEGKRAATEILTLIRRFGHLDDEEYINEQRVYGQVALAKFLQEEKTTDSYELALEYYGKAREFYMSQGDQLQVRGIESSMARVKSMRDGRKQEPPSKQTLNDLRYNYGQCVKEKGEESSDSVRSGIILITGLLTSGENSFECERLSAKLRTISRRVHGPDHDLTDRIESGLRQSRVRRLVKVRDGVPVEYRVQQVNDEERKYVAVSPHDGMVSEISFDDDYMIMPGTPVVCDGLKNAQHLNGKLGDVRSFDKEIGRYVVRFEDKTLNKASVRPANLRVVIDLPDES